MQSTLQTATVLYAPKPTKPIQHNLLQTKGLPNGSSRCSSGFSEIAERMSETRRDSQNPVERDDCFMGNEEKVLNDLEKEIDDLLDL